MSIPSEVISDFLPLSARIRQARGFRQSCYRERDEPPGDCKAAVRIADHRPHRAGLDVPILPDAGWAGASGERRHPSAIAAWRAFRLLRAESLAGTKLGMP